MRQNQQGCSYKLTDMELRCLLGKCSNTTPERMPTHSPLRNRLTRPVFKCLSNNRTVLCTTPFTDPAPPRNPERLLRVKHTLQRTLMKRLLPSSSAGARLQVTVRALTPVKVSESQRCIKKAPSVASTQTETSAHWLPTISVTVKSSRTPR